MSPLFRWLGLILVSVLFLGACAPAQPAQPAQPPVAKATQPAKPAGGAAAGVPSPAAVASPSPSPAAGVAPSPIASPIARSVVVPPTPADFPQGPIELWVGFPAGGSTDVGARILAAAMEGILQRPVQVINRAGGSGQLAWTELARQQPSANTLAMINVPQLQTTIIDPERQAAFQLDDLTPIANQVLDPGAIFVAQNSRFQTLEDLLQAARQNPGAVTVGDTGIASDDHLAILELEQRANVDFRIVHFQGGAPLTAAVLGGQIDAAFDNVGGWLTRVQAGDGRVLAVTAETRSQFLPAVPTAQELGFPVISYSARGIAGPPNLKPDHVSFVSAVIEAAMNTPEVQRRMFDVGLAQEYMGPQEYQQFLQAQMERAQQLFTLVEQERAGG